MCAKSWLLFPRYWRDIIQGYFFVANKTTVRAHLQGTDLANWPWGPRSSGISHVPGHWPLLETSRVPGSFPPLVEIPKKSNSSALEGRTSVIEAPSFEKVSFILHPSQSLRATRHSSKEKKSERICERET